MDRMYQYNWDSLELERRAAPSSEEPRVIARIEAHKGSAPTPSLSKLAELAMPPRFMRAF